MSWTLSGRSSTKPSCAADWKSRSLKRGETRPKTLVRPPVIRTRPIQRNGWPFGVVYGSSRSLTNQSAVYSLQTSKTDWTGRDLRTSSSAMLRYFKEKEGLCSEKFLSDCGRPASRKATFRPASERRLHAQPPEAPEPTTMASNFSPDEIGTENPSL